MGILLVVLVTGLVIIGLNRYKNLKHNSTGTVKDVLLQPEQLKIHANQIARQHVVAKKPKYIKSLPGRLDNNFRAITEVYKDINSCARKGRDLTPASEWLLDNYYKVEEQVKEVRQNLTRERLQKLNILKTGVLKGYPRVYAIALELISHTDGRLDQGLLIDFVASYQRYSKLSSAEVWSLSLMTRLALIENIRYICDRVHKTQRQWEAAGKLIEGNKDELLPALMEYTKEDAELNPSFIEHLLRRLRKDGIDSGDVIDLIDEKLFDYGLAVKSLIDQEHKEQASRKISVGNAITSLNMVAVLDWNDIFESLCTVHGILKQDPLGVYSNMDFESRDYYRKLIEKMAKKAKVSQISVARKALGCAKEALDYDDSGREGHIGYYIAGKGRKKLLTLLNHGKAKGDKFHNYSVSTYLFIVAFFTLIIMTVFLYYSYFFVAEKSIFLNLLVAIAVLIPASDMTIGVINRIFTHYIPPGFLPKMEYKDGIPDSARTLVVVPTLLPSKDRVKELISNLEVYYLANREENLYFAIAGDFRDSNKDTMAGDEEIIRAGMESIKKLNEKYSTEGDIFFFLARHRQYNAKHDKWMGWERKRGALLELNALLEGDKNTSYGMVSGDIYALKVKYVITLDADTNLTIDVAKKLIGTIAHPLNRAVYDGDTGIVRDGYGIIQPRISIDIESANRSAFTRIFAGQGGIDPYTTAISDIYQDLFSEGIFTGKGIYDVHVFNKVLKGAFPENAVLSHDLLEGSFVRAALATDIELIDDYPSGYGSYMMRLHRWVRGDWQLIRWLGKGMKNEEGEDLKNPLTLLSRWKITDNLRRSLVPVFQLLLLLLGLTVLPGNPGVWVALTILTIMFRFLIDVADVIIFDAHSGFGGKFNGNLISGLRASAYRDLLIFVFLPYNAYITADAIIRTLYRVFVSRKNMLEWVTASEVERAFKNDLTGYAKKMGRPAMFAVAVLVLSLLSGLQGLPYVLVIGGLWLLSPGIAHRISIIEDKEYVEISFKEIEDLRKLSRKTWAYYEDFTDRENNFLTPDNVQIDPPNGVAHRTSPTNIGFMLISMLSAGDFGYISIPDMVDRLDQSVTTIENMEKWHGHLYNWYDTKTLEILRPYFVSTVDSGNLVGYFICLKEGLREYYQNPIVSIERVQGLMDTALLVKGDNRVAIDILRSALSEGAITLVQWRDLLTKLKDRMPEDDNWGMRFNRTVVSFIREADYIFPNSRFFDGDNRNNRWDGLDRVIDTLGRINDGASLTGLLQSFDNIIETAEGLSAVYRHKSDRLGYLTDLRDETIRAKANAKVLFHRMESLIKRIDEMIDATEFVPLYDNTRHLFSVGYSVEDEKLINAYYDLLASEARIASYIAIARREVPKKHWFKLGRALSVVDGYRGLVSWAGTMFEYLMPHLVLKNYKNTLLDETYGTIVKAQKSYGDRRDVPWGISESGYYAFDMLFNYQYKAFGVPDFGLKRGLAEDMVVSPYSTLLALGIEPRLAIDNLKRLRAEGLEGDYGFYEAVDFTPNRLPRGKKRIIVKSYMAHHQGMGFIALNNFLNDNIIQKRLHREPMIKSAEILLQEKIPLKVIITKEYKETVRPLEIIDREEVKVIRIFGEPDMPLPHCHVLSNGRYSLMLTNGGDGYSKTDKLQVTRWREDPVRGNYGVFVFLRNLNTKQVWSNTYKPLGKSAEGYMAIFSQDKAEYYRTDGEIDTHSEVVVTTEDDAEVRKISLTNHGNSPVTVEVTSYLEPVLVPQAADIAHPAFSNLFVRTEFVSQYDSIIASRRPRETNQKTLWAFHTMAVEGETAGNLQYETIRENFIGRGRDITNPVALTKPLTNTAGIVLDPAMCLRRKIRVGPGKVVNISFTTGLAHSREQALANAAKYHNPASIARAFELALTRSQVETTYLNLRAGEIKTYQNMISQIVYSSPLRRKYKDLIEANKKGQSGLWPYGISGDVPFVLLSIDQTDHAQLVRECLRAHEYWRLKGLQAGLVILNRDGGNYLQPLQELVNELVLSSNGRDVIGKPGGVHVLNADIMPEEDIGLLYAAARIILKGGEGPIGLQVSMPEEDEEELPGEKSFNRYDILYEGRDYPLELVYFNGYGGFTEDGREYIIRLKENNHTPAPWINVISNDSFGFFVSESGSGSVWAENSRENKLTPWSNDPVTDPPGEVLYLRDEENGDLWSITPLPIRDGEDYTIRQGLGYSVFHHLSHGIDQSLKMFVPKEDPVKLSMVRLKNEGVKGRKLSITYYIRPVLGISDHLTQQYIYTEYDIENQVFCIGNPFNYDFPGRIAFVAVSENISSYTGDRREFLGRGGDLSSPGALSKVGLSNRAGVGYDPCAAVQIHLELDAGEEKELVFLFGQSHDREQMGRIINKYKGTENCHRALEEVREYWQNILEVIKVETPDPSMDLMLNYWLMYQTVVCRMKARTAFYQSGGAYGFRDQLQDAVNIVYALPRRTRRQILMHCAHQFVEGDVQHWWHPCIQEKGIRTRFTDDLLWLPYATAEYIKRTGDYEILKEEVHYLEDLPLGENEDERYGTPRVSKEKSCVYEHCKRAIKRALKYGEHGIPLMGSGDWNDGMNTVGNKGKGESIWLGWFLCDTLTKFLPLCDWMGDRDSKHEYAGAIEGITEAIEQNGWDGAWYRRAYFDDGTPLGSSENTECTIDSIAQSWAVISGRGEPKRAAEAMNSAEHYLVRRNEGLILLFTPPFDESELEPGYIKGYVPGVRENGGQYTHAAAWVVNAFAMLGHGDKAWEFFNMINPINHARTPIECATYKVEPYVAAADVYAVAPHSGRGGWTWYTGAAGWMYRVGLEYMLGFKKEDNRLRIEPCIPKEWAGYTIEYRYRETKYHIEVKNPDRVNRGVRSIVLDDKVITEGYIPLLDDGNIHRVEVTLGDYKDNDGYV